MTTIQIIIFVLQIIIGALCGYALANIIFVHKDLTNVLKYLNKIIDAEENSLNLIKETNEHCKNVTTFNNELIKFNRNNLDQIISLNSAIYFVKRYMVRRKKPIND